MGRVAATEEDLRPLRIIAAALITGPVLFLALALYLRSNPESVHRTRPPADTLTWVSLFLGLAVIGTSVILPRPRGGDIGRVRAHFIVRLALVEGGSLFGTVAYLLEGQDFALGISVLCIAVMLLLHFPTEERVRRALAEPS